MEKRIRRYYFVIVKAAGILAVLFWGLSGLDMGQALYAFAFLAGAVFLFCAVSLELREGDFGIAVTAQGRERAFLHDFALLGEGILAMVSVFLFPLLGIYYSAIVILDFITVLSWRRGEHYFYWYLSGYLPLLSVCYHKLNLGFYVLVLSFLILFYYQQKQIIVWYQEQLYENNQVEYRLKSDMKKSRLHHRDELRQSRLHYDNKMLKEKERLAQALHDKLGHSINGSLYKLEAAKLLLDNKPEESRGILEEVIEHLRGSMDEIRIILRNERPDKQRMAMISLQALCEECEEQYHIHTGLKVVQEGREIPEKIWEVILDNTFEAVTNSLKYAKCEHIAIEIIVLGEVLRCSIRDDGMGAVDYQDGMGLAGMKKRVREVKGYLDIESESGFAINMILPLT